MKTFECNRSRTLLLTVIMLGTARVSGADPLQDSIPTAEQESKTNETHEFTLRSHRYPETKMFAIMQFGAMGLTSQERYNGADDFRLTTDLGLMRNLGEHWAVGGSFRLESTETDDATGFLVRGRRWLSDGTSLDLSTGFLGHGSNGSPLDTSWITQAQLNLGNIASLQVEMDRWKLNGMDYDTSGHYGMLTDSGTNWYVGGSVHYLPGLAALIGFAGLVAVTWD
jgi:hypothetical protein